MNPLRLLVPTLVLATCAAAADRPRVDPSTPEPMRSMLDSLTALPDSAWDVPPGLDRQQVIDFMRRMARSPDSIYSGPDVAHLPDAEMKRVFEAHEAAFAKLVRMFEADSTADRVDGPNFIVYRPPGPFSAARQEEYDSLMRRLGVRMLVREKDGLILLRTTTVHTFDRRGYAFSRRPVTPIIERETLNSSPGVTPVFRRLKGHWYTYFQAMS